MLHQQAAATVVQHMSWADVGGLAVVFGFIALLVWLGNR